MLSTVTLIERGPFQQHGWNIGISVNSCNKPHGPYLLTSCHAQTHRPSLLSGFKRKCMTSQLLWVDMCNMNCLYLLAGNWQITQTFYPTCHQLKKCVSPLGGLSFHRTIYALKKIQIGALMKLV